MTARAAGLLLAALLAGCAPRAGVRVGPDGQTRGAVSGGLGPVRLGVNSAGGGFVGTHLGPIGIGAGF